MAVEARADHGRSDAADGYQEVDAAVRRRLGGEQGLHAFVAIGPAVAAPTGFEWVDVRAHLYFGLF
jgi:hypothetical protein